MNEEQEKTDSTPPWWHGLFEDAITELKVAITDGLSPVENDMLVIVAGKLIVLAMKHNTNSLEQLNTLVKSELNL